MSIREIARAKVNLTLRVLGRRPDGYHEIESLVVFAEVGDRVTFSPGPDCLVQSAGPFAGAIVGQNLLARALDLLRELDCGLTLGTVLLEKNLPVAAGLGGGSADAAALLRAVRRANPQRAGGVDWHKVAARLGADLPVCLAGVPAMMRGIGERVEPLAIPPGLPEMAVVLVNPGLPLTTADVFGALAAGPGVVDHRPTADVRGFTQLAGLIEFMQAHGNDLERPATALLPVIGEVKSALAGLQGCLLSAMSGSGPTCFGVFADDASAARAAATLASQRPNWWIVPTRIAQDAAPGLN